MAKKRPARASKSPQSRKKKKAASSPAKDVSDVLHILKEYEEKAVERTVLFCDLVGSTEYKRHNPGLNGFIKVELHNKTARELASGFPSAQVVKSLGDGLLITFEGQRGPTDALVFALEMVERIEKENSDRGWKSLPQAIETRIGIHCGSVWMYHFPESQSDDPHGSVVDIAARLCGIAAPQQIICSEAVFEHVDGTGRFANNNCHKRFVKGIDSPLDVVAIEPESRADKPPKARFSGHSRPVSRITETLLEKARLSVEQKRYGVAGQTFETALKEDPGSFEANFRLGELLIFHPRDLRPGASNMEVLEEVFEKLGVAKQICPNSCRVWLLASHARFKYHEELVSAHGEMTDAAANNLRLSMTFAATALAKAEEVMDTEGIISSQIRLARVQLMCRKILNDPIDIEDIVALCDQVDCAFTDVMEKRRSEYLVTNVLVRLESGEEDYERFEEMLDEASRISPKSKDVARAKATLFERIADAQTEDSALAIGRRPQ